MHIILINLARAADRRRKMENQFADLNLAFELLEATDGLSLTAEDRAAVDHEKRRRITPYPLSDNEVGCWISHRRAMQRLIESGSPMAAVVEDDAALSPDFPRVLAAVEEQGPHFDFIFLHRKFKEGEIFAPSRHLLPNVKLGRVGLAHMGAIAYVVSRKGAQKFLSYAPRFAHAVDKEIHRYWANGLDIYGLEKPVVAHGDENYSYIDETRGQDRPKERACYPDADRLYWRLCRRWTQMTDSVQKRLAFPAYVKRGRKAGNI